jgi:hypothetical protein
MFQRTFEIFLKEVSNGFLEENFIFGFSNLFIIFLNFFSLKSWNIKKENIKIKDVKIFLYNILFIMRFLQFFHDILFHIY